MSDSEFEIKRQIDAICDEFEGLWAADGKTAIESLLDRVDPGSRQQLLEQLLAIDIELRTKDDQTLVAADYQDLGDDAVRHVQGLLKADSPTRSMANEDATRDFTGQPEDPDSTLAPDSESGQTESPVSVGRYQIETVLGKGGFGLVYKAYDEQLQRHVAVKVPHAHLVHDQSDAEAYLTEARTVASLDHPNIVPVHDVGQSDEFPCYVVSRFVEGTDLSKRIKEQPLLIGQAVELVATIAEALHYAHKQGLVHRDVKPGNILLGDDGKPYLVDFGLALKEQKVGTGAEYAGTPAYMSPEQARGEGHRVDGRSDIYSLGVVLYELLTGKRTFSAESAVEMLQKVASLDVKPPRQINDAVPRELERICLKSLSRRASDRYTTALDLADDLRHFVKEQSAESLMETGVLRGSGQETDSTKAGIDSATPQFDSDSREIRVVPKGLRSFDAHDADFFLELLPGPRDRDGLPDSIRFWKTKIEESDPDLTFSIGLIYGPSGCGKSSLVKAGLLPRLSEDVIPIYIEATPDETESRLLHGLRKACPHLDRALSLVDSLAAIRQGQPDTASQKVLIVLDQFEQWLHAKKEDENTELVQALRQCDGSHLQCIVMVRDDFWMAATRFMRELEVRLVEAENSAAVDLFDLDHSRKVLGAFGRAFGKLPDGTRDVTADQREFLQQSVAGLAEEGKVICVRLALFAQMMKGKSWTPDTLTEVGGTSGVGVTFLEETFSASTAPPEHRYHQKAARGVLKSLLPDSGTDIKGHMRSRAELLEASSYEDRPKEFDDLIRILDSEIRLITPTDPEGIDSDESPVPTDAGQKYYQLTHDYLVPSLRDWLTRKQKETRQGRAELTLADRAAVWQARPENRQLPSLWQWLQIRRYTRDRNWTKSQREMMRRATRIHGIRTILACALIFVLVSLGFVVRQEIVRGQEETRIKEMVNSLFKAEPDQIPKIVAQLDENPELATTFLTPLITIVAQTPDEKRAQLHARLASVSRDPSQVDPLVEELLTGKVTYVLPIRQMLLPWAATLTERFREVLRNDKDPQRRFRAALALTEYGPPSATNGWTEEDLRFVAEQLVLSNPEYRPLLRGALRPIRDKLLPDLGRIFAAADATDAQRLSAANAFADYAASDVDTLLQYLTVATPKQFAVLYPLVAASSSPSMVEGLSKTAATLPSNELGSVERITYGQQRANAAVTLVRLGEREEVLPVFDYTDDPEALTQFIFRCRERGVGAEPLLELLDIETQRVGKGPALDITSEAFRRSARARYAMLLALGEFQLDDIPETRCKPLLEQLADWYANDPSSGVHGASGWLLRQWGQTETAQKIEQTEVPYSPDREWFTLAITVTPTSPPTPENSEDEDSEQDGDENDDAVPPDDNRAANDENPTAEESQNPDSESADEPEHLPEKTFYYTFIVFPAGEYWIGSVKDETPRLKDETRHQVELTHPFALLDREITFEELIAFQSFYVPPMQKFDAGPGDAGFGADWYDAVGFSRWLGQQMGLPEDQQAYPAPDALDEAEYPREPDPNANWAPRNWPVELGNQGFRLPTEAEWEVAARSGARTVYGFGSDVGLLDRFGWFTENSGEQVHPPRELRPSLRGMFDLHGNLLEWTHDWVDDSEFPESNRVFRGGGWNREAAFSRSAFRGGFRPTSRSVDKGFRLALSLSAESPEAQDEQAEPEGGGTEGASAEQRPKMP